MPCDVADFDSCARAVAEVQSKLGAVDVLVNNAGITRDMTFKKMDKVNWDAVMRTNLDSLFNMTKQVADGMVERNWGRVINVSSVNGSKGAFGQTNYSAAKAGVHGFTKALALEVAKKGVTVNTISPGYIGTKMVTAIPEEILELEDPAADPGRPARQARGGGRPDHLPRLRRGRVRDRRQHRHQRRPAHAMTPRPRRTTQHHKEHIMMKSGIDQDALITCSPRRAPSRARRCARRSAKRPCKALQGRELTLDNIRKVVKNVTQAASTGAARNPAPRDRRRGAARKALAGIDAALLQAVEANRKALAAVRRAAAPG